MIKEAFEYLLNLPKKARQPLLTPADESGRIFLFDDKSEEYREIPRFVSRKRGVSNVESFAAMVLEEARRAQSDGDWMTVIFKDDGARFHLDDRDGRIAFSYKRQLSPQWELLVGAVGRGFEHREFVTLLQKLRPSLGSEYPRLLSEFRKVTFGTGLRIDSAPILTDGKAGLQYAFELTAASGVTKTALPAEMLLEFPFSRGGKKVYSIQAEIDIRLVDRGEGKKTFHFSVLLPDREALEEQAVADEVAWFREAAASLPKLSILEDY